MRTKLWAKLASCALAAALVLGAVHIAEAVESVSQPAAPSAQSEASEAAIPSPSVPVSGFLTDPQGHPLMGFELHFQGQVNHDAYTVRTRAGGSFSTALPSGVYDLRGEHGEIIASRIRVYQRALSVGHVETPAPLAPTRLFDRQAMAEAILESPAPSGARVRAPGGGVGPVAVIPAPHPMVEGAPGGKAMAPARVIPMGIEQQLQLPAGASPTIGSPPAGSEMVVPPGQSQPVPSMPSTE